MKTIFEGEVLEVISSGNDVFFSYIEKRDELEITVAFKMYSIKDGKVTNVAKNLYQLAKFGANYKAFSAKTQNYMTCKTVILINEQMLILEKDGLIKLLDTDASVLWEGDLRYGGNAPCSISVSGSGLWACYSQSNVLVRYNLNTMREELRIGGGENSPFDDPCDIDIVSGYALVCNRNSLQILKIDLQTYALNIHKELSEPAEQFIKVGLDEFIVTKSGLYKIT